MAALLIIPGAAARFWTERLATMVLLATLFGLTIGAAGAAASARFDTLPTGPIIVLTGTALFLVSATLAPRRGGIARWLAARRFARRVAVRRLLCELYEHEAIGAEDAIPSVATLDQGLWSERDRRTAHLAARREGLVVTTARGDALTDVGRAAALDALRDERLWQAVLVEFPELAVGAANPFHETAAEVLPGHIVTALIERLRAEGRWPEELRAISSPGGSA
jgi:manganese/zinc/iron transport system permease protein